MDEESNFRECLGEHFALPNVPAFPVGCLQESDIVHGDPESQIEPKDAFDGFARDDTTEPVDSFFVGPEASEAQYDKLGYTGLTA